MAMALAISASLAIPAFAAEATVGQFVQELARAKNLNATDARIAADALRAAGVRLPSNLDLGKRLTQADVATIAREFGLRVTTSRPGQAFDSEQVDQFFVSFAADLAITGSESFATNDDCAPGEDCTNPGEGSGPGNGMSGPPFDPFTKGKGKAKGKSKQGQTPTDPE